VNAHLDALAPKLIDNLARTEARVTAPFGEDLLVTPSLDF